MKSSITPEAKIAWIGTGTMGAPMVGNLARAGHQVTAWNRTMPCAGIEQAASQGCTIAKTIEEALDGSQVVCTCVTNGSALRSVLFAPDRNLKRLLSDEPIVVDFATIGPVEARSIATELRASGIRFADSPMTGGDIGARNGALTFMVGANDDDLETIRPLLEVLGKKIVHAGPVGSGQSLKLVNQLFCGVNLLAVVEAFRVAEQLGMDRSLVVEACGGGAAGSWQLVNLGPKIIAQDHQPGFKAKDLLKDLRFLRDVLEEGSLSGQLPCLAQALSAFEGLVQAGNGELGTQAVWMAHPSKANGPSA